jgi:HEAT repeat protein
MNIEEVKQQFPEVITDIAALEEMGLSDRQTGWIDRLDSHLAMTACWLFGNIGNNRDADELINILAGDRHDLWMQAATSLSLIATAKHLQPLLSLLATSTNLDRRSSIVYALSFLPVAPVGKWIAVLTEIAADRTEPPAIRGQALEGLGNKLSSEIPANISERAISVIIRSLDDAEPEVRFWACFAVGALKLTAALPRLQILAKTDRAIVPSWQSVSAEAEDTIKRLTVDGVKIIRGKDSHWQVGM